MAKIMRLSPPRFAGCAAALVAMLCWLPHAGAQEPPPPQGVSRGENFSAKPPAQLFASDCTGAGCHKSPQGLGRAQGFGSLAGFLREHYTNSRESAAALANYLSKLPGGPDREARTPRSGRPTVSVPPSGGPGSIEGPSGEGKPSPQEARGRQGATGRVSRTAPKPEDEPEVHHHPAAEPAEAAAKPEPPSRPGPRERRGRQPATAAVVPPSPPAPPAPEPQAAPAPPPPTPPAPKQYDIFD